MKIEWENSEVVGGIAKSDIGNYIRLKLVPRNNNKYYALYLHIRKWKEDGCKENKLCQAQEVAAFKTADIELAKINAEKWFEGFAKDMLGFSNFSLNDLLR